MRNRNTASRMCAVILGLACGHALASDEPAPADGVACSAAGPQTPRDIDSKAGTNTVRFKAAPEYQKLNLCNIHFHAQAEHKSADYSIPAGEGASGGYQCAMSKQLTATELTAPDGDICKGLKPGDTVEVHWVHSSCDVKPGKTLGACVADTCKNPLLRVEAQVFTLVNDPSALDFNDMTQADRKVKGKHQAKKIPASTGVPVQFAGSTTGPIFNDQVCSGFKVTWAVRPRCAKLNIATLGAWCKTGNVFAEDHAHGVRKLVTDPAYLAPIK